MINRTSPAAASAAALILGASLVATLADAQTALIRSSEPQAPAPAPAPASYPVHQAKIAEGTEIRVHLGDRLSSATSTVGDEFVIVSDEEIQLPDGTVIPAGYSGRGEVTAAEKNGMLGKSGQLGVRLNYLKVGATRIHLRANKAGEGASGVTNTVVLTVLFGPLGLLVHGHSVVYPKGTALTAYVDQDAMIDVPVPPPPVID